MDAKKIRECAAEMIRFADWCEAKEQPPKPSQAWLDKHGVELTGEYRQAEEGELSYVLNSDRKQIDEDFSPMTAGHQWLDPRWILRKRAAATPPAGLLQGDWEHTGELREPRKLAIGYEPWMNCDGRVLTDAVINKPGCASCQDIPGYTDARRWIVRPKAKPAPKVTPWTLATVPMPLVVRRKNDITQSLLCAISAGTGAVCLGRMSPTYGELLSDYEQRDGSPCGEVAK